MAFLSVGALALWAVSSTIATPAKNSKAKPQAVISVTTEVIPLAITTNTTVGQAAPAAQVTTITAVSTSTSGPEKFNVLVESNGTDAKTAENKDVSPKTILKVADKPTLGDAFIFQNTIQVFLDRPLTLSLYNAQGQLVYHQDSQRKLETIPLQGIQAGFLYLTMRLGNAELTKKLLYTGR